MKLAKKQDWPFILLETLNDVLIYKGINEQIKAKQSINLYFGFKSQTFKNSISDYACHEVESNNSMAKVMSIAIECENINGKSKHSLIEYCNLSDKIINDIHTAMLKYIENSQTVRVNKMGGFCNVLPEDIFDNIQEINELELYNYLLHGETNIDFKIISKTIIIENDSFIPKNLINNYINLTGENFEDLQIITSFKHKTILFNNENWFKFFLAGYQQGLTNIVFESTGQDVRQIYAIKNILESVANKNNPINIYVKSWRIEQMLPNLSYDKTKLKIIILK